MTVSTAGQCPFCPKLTELGVHGPVLADDKGQPQGEAGADGGEVAGGRDEAHWGLSIHESRAEGEAALVAKYRGIFALFGPF